MNETAVVERVLEVAAATTIPYAMPSPCMPCNLRRAVSAAAVRRDSTIRRKWTRGYMHARLSNKTYIYTHATTSAHPAGV